MSKLIVVNDAVADPSAPRIIRTPGVGGYLSRFIAGHVDMAVGATISAWNSVAGSAASTLSASSSTVTVAEENGIRHLHTNGGTGGRLLGPHIAQRPQTLVAVVKASAPATGVVAAASQVASRDADGKWQGSGGATAFTTYSNSGWTFIIIAQAADNTYLMRADDVESATVAGATAPTAFGGIYFGPGTAGHTADVREIIHYGTQLDKAGRDAVHAYMKTRYPDLP